MTSIDPQPRPMTRDERMDAIVRILLKGAERRLRKLEERQRLGTLTEEEALLSSTLQHARDAG